MIDLQWKDFYFEGISEGGIQTCLRVKPLDILFDIGKCPEKFIHTPTLLMTHGHLDHSAGIPYYISQRSLRRLPPPTIYVPPQLKPDLLAVMDVYAKIEDFRAQCNIIDLEYDKYYYLNKKYYFKAIPSVHRVPSNGYVIYEKVSKMKAEYLGLGREEILSLKSKGVAFTEEKYVPTIAFSGDTQTEFLINNPDIQNAKILFLECTYIDKARTIEQTREWGHIHLDELVEHSKYFKNEKIVLIHFSKRYRYDFIRETVNQKLSKLLPDKVMPWI